MSIRLLTLFTLAVACTGLAAGRPNVLLIAIDDLNDWVGCMDGHPQAHTPNIDRLAKRGVLFTNAHCQAPICGPSRASIMTGLYPSTTGIYGQIRYKELDKHPLVRKSKTPYLPNWFAEHGYDTLAAGKLFHGTPPKKAFGTYGGGFGGSGPKPPNKQRFVWTPPERNTQTDWGVYPTGPDADAQMPDTKVARWVVDQLGRAHEGPVFLGAGFVRPHVPWYVPAGWFERYKPVDKVKVPVVPEDDLDDLPPISMRVHKMAMMPNLKWMREHDQERAATQAYLACVEFVDSRVGMVVDALDRSDLADDTVIVLFSDHGYHMGEKHRWTKHSLWERSTRVPLIIVPPRRDRDAKRGVTCDATVGLIDLYPTLVDLCGLPANASNEGRSLAPLLRDPDAAWDRPALTTYGRRNHAVRTDRYRYIRYEDGAEELYDHSTDTHEWRNLANDPAHSDVKARLAKQLPTNDAPWYAGSYMTTNEYFEDHIKRHTRPDPP